MAEQKPDIVVPESAANLGPIMTGELRSKNHLYPEVLAQFSKIVPHTRKTRLYVYPTANQAKLISDDQGPFSFKGLLIPQDGVEESYIATDVWLDSISQIHHYEANYWTQTSGKIGNLTIRRMYTQKPVLADRASSSNSAWFVAGRCFVLQSVANTEDEELAASAKFGIKKVDLSFTFSGGAQATVRRYTRLHSFGANRELKRKGYSITVNGTTDAEIAKADVDAFLVLASFASRERSVNAHWSYGTKEDMTRVWRFNFRRFKRRLNNEDPLVLRDRGECHAFLQKAFQIYSASKHQPLLDASVFALLAENQTTEMKIAHLFSGIQGALIFATNPSTTRSPIAELYRRFVKLNPNVFNELWPLLDPRYGPPLAHFRHAIVHGEAFNEREWLALSYAGEHLQWHLERIILAALGWDYQRSHVSDKSLRRYYARSKWQVERSKIAVQKPASVK